mmetsp:Transcript_13427/g.38170  ORF Transcript_13427/g.38170 Transcript_13427/m.38170 type:complete len:295 (-) Transcript_13427:335-1219(-)
MDVVLLLDHLYLVFEPLHLLAVPLHVPLQHALLLLEPPEVGVAPAGLRLRGQRLELELLGLRADPGLRLAAGPVQGVTLVLGRPEAGEFLLPLLRELLHDRGRIIDGLLEAVRADDLLDVLQQALLVGRQRLGLHERDLLHLALQDEETVVLEVHAAGEQQLCHLREVARLPFDVVLGLVVAERLAPHGELRALHDLEVLRPVAGVHDVLEGHLHLRAARVWHLVGAVDQLGDLVQAHLLRALAEDEEHGVDGVGLATAVRTHDRREALVEGPDDLAPAVRLEVLEDDLVDHEP